MISHESSIGTLKIFLTLILFEKVKTLDGKYLLSDYLTVGGGNRGGRKRERTLYTL